MFGACPLLRVRGAHLASLLLLVNACAASPAVPAPRGKPAPSGGPAASASADQGAPAAPATGLAASCASVKSKHDALIAEAERGEHPLDSDVAETLGTLGTCIPAGRGAWVVRLGLLSSLPVPFESSSGDVTMVNMGSGALEAVYVEPEGAPPDVGSGVALGIAGFASLEVERQLTFDYDADGTPELAFCMGAAGVDAYETECILVTRKKDVTRAYEDLPAGIFVRDIDDVDVDGRPDVLSMGPFELPCDDPKRSPCVAPLVPGPRGFLYHSLPDGSFTPSDGAARAHAAKVFPYDMAQLFEHDRPPPGSDVATLMGTGANAVRGALALGEDRKKIRTELARLRKEYCQKPLDCPSFDAMESWPSSPFWPAKGRP